ncbi:MAG: excinuclease ABC subunit UvrA [Ruminococcaceae bacterium]|nr:excinuclease ABC subunit UvrA [Oscillospiraceae bacterium]
MAIDKIVIKGAREHNLKNIDIEIPRDKLIVLTGLSGSGKSSLAFDTLYAEGQRRYVESLSSYARQFLGQMEKPDVDSIEGLSPAISIDQKTTSKNPRSTVGTVTEIYDYLRLLYAHIGVPHCPVCGREILHQSTDQIVDKVLELANGTRILLLSPVIRAKKGEHKSVFEDMLKKGYARVRVDGNVYDLTEEIKLEKNKRHDIDVVIDRLVIKEGIAARLTDSIETALKLSGGLVAVKVLDGEEFSFSENYACPEHNISMPDLAPRMFSFNSPFGACPTCTGLGIFMKINPRLLVPDESKSLADGCIRASGWGTTGWGAKEQGTIALMYYKGLAEHYGFDVNAPFSELSDEVKDIIFYGTGNERIKFTRTSEWGAGGTFSVPFEGVVNNLERRYKETSSDYSRNEIESLMTELPCPDCGGARLKPEILSVTVGGLNIKELCDLQIVDSLTFFQDLQLDTRSKEIAAPIIKEVKSRLEFLISVGLDYLTLSRASGTLSGGESQRIRLATQIGSSLMGVLYILDEPSIGLHQRDNSKLIETLQKLRDLGNTVIVVEHDEDTMRAADHIVDIGPGAGVHGGEIICSGTPLDICNCKKSITGNYLSGAKKIPVPSVRRKGNGRSIEVKGASENNLKNINVKFPLGQMICVTGVSGSGKSSLINSVLYQRLASELNGAKRIWGKHKELKGLENLDKVIEISQAPIGRTPRSNPATYTGVFNDIRELFAATKDAKLRGYSAGRFSFNVRGGRCEACEGDGIIKIAMHFLPDIYVPCEVCKGSRYNRETLEVKYRDKSIYDVLEMTVEEAMYFFESLPKIHRKLQTLFDVGLGYVKLGQPATTLSGGEAQRVKLATELSKKPTGRTIYILDEPTTGLHTADVHRLIEVFNRLVDAGNSMIIIEHNLDVIKSCDHIIDLGPEGGDKGGNVVCTGTPEQIAECEESYTGQFLKKIL